MWYFFYFNGLSSIFSFILMSGTETRVVRIKY